MSLNMKYLIAALIALLPLSIFANDHTTPVAQNDKYQVFLNIEKVVDDKVQVEIIVPKTDQNELEFHMPKIVPGTYAIYDFGRFLSDFKALDGEGNELKVEALTDNRWKIKGAEKLQKITYWVEDSWDTDKGNVIFEPAGTNIEAGKNFMINTHGFIGYIDGMKANTYELNIQRPAKFFGATSLSLSKTEKNTDTYTVVGYGNLADSPIMYSIPDTTSIIVGGAEILVAVYSPNNVVSSKFVMNNVKDILSAQKDYLGGTLPINKYAFIIYLMDNMSKSGASGALEHSQSSLYTLPEMEPEYIAQTIRDVAAHEFFHIVTPLNIHSEEIHDYDFINPKMSKHLWLYEGLTEYAAHHVQIKHNLIELDQYLQVMGEKMRNADGFNDSLPFTKMSKYCLDLYEAEYGNVYEKGALIGMCLDIKLRKLSDGKFGTQELMRELSKLYGKEKAFKDEELFQKITDLTYPEIGEFFKRYVEGSEALPYKEILTDVGIAYEEQKEEPMFYIKGMGIAYNHTSGVVNIMSLEEMTVFADAISLEEKDEWIKYDGKLIELNSLEAFLGQLLSTTKIGEKHVLISAKRNEKGKLKKKKIKLKTIEAVSMANHSLSTNPEATKEQLTLRKNWINQ
jgi:predicted metalloprotease with PDZ domain